MADPEDPLGLLRLMFPDEGSSVPIQDKDIRALLPWGGGGGAASAVPAPLRTSMTKTVGAKTGTADLTGVGDLIANLSFRRLWESYNPKGDADQPDWWETLTGRDSITKHQGRDMGYLWGYVDPSWLSGYAPGNLVTTITEQLAKTGGGGGPRNVFDYIKGMGGTESDVSTGHPPGDPRVIPFIPPITQPPPIQDPWWLPPPPI